MRRLWVWHPPNLIGTLEQTDAGLAFTYSKEWLSFKKNFRLSNSLALSEQRYDREATAFFGNLLPEGGARESLCRKFGISVDNDFELLVRIGEDCAGALVITQKDEPPDDKRGLEEIPIAALDGWLREGASGLLDLQVKGDLRLSLAGAQNKLPIVYQDGKFYKPLGAQPTTHILKPFPRGFRNLPQNEWLNGQLYAEFGLTTARSGLIRIGARYALLVERYDRVKISDQWHRLHQEDFCQALALPFKKKYEAEGGPSLENCIELLDMRSDDVAADTDSLLKWQMLNVLIGNCDGHGKNLSLLRHQDGSWRLAPFYDLVATTIFPRLSTKLAMSINGQVEYGTIHPKNWRDQLEKLKVSPAHYIRVLNDFTSEMPNHLDTVLKRFEEIYGKNTFAQEYRVHQLKILRRNRQLLESEKKG